MVDYLWEWFWTLDAMRRCGFTPEPIGAVEIEAWARLSGTDVRPWEFSALRRMDAARLNALADLRSPKKPQRKRKEG